MSPHSLKSEQTHSNPASAAWTIDLAISDWEIERSPGAVLLYDSSGTVVDASPEACRILGLARDDLLGSSTSGTDWVVTESPAGPTSEHPVNAALQSHSAQRGYLIRVRRPDASDVWLLCDAMPGGEGVALTITDVSHMVRSGVSNARSTGGRIVAEIEDELAAARLNSRAILEKVIEKLSTVRFGMWVGVLMGKDLGLSTVVARDSLEPAMTGYLEAYLATRQGPTASPLMGVTQQVIDSGKPLRMNNASLDQVMTMTDDAARQYLALHPLPVELEPLDLMVVPMRAGGATIGTLGLFERRASNPLTDRDVEWLQALADRVGLAIENAQLHEDAIKRLDRLGSLASVGLALRTSSDLRLTLKLILDQALTRLKVDAADVLVVDESGGSLALVASAGFHMAVADYRVPVSEAMPGPASGRRLETLTLLGAFSQSRRRSLIAREGFRAYGAVPLIARDKLLGVLEVFHRAPLEPDEEWLAFLDALASDAAIAIDTAATRESLRLSGGPASRATKPGLSDLETRVLRLLVEGMTNAEIAVEVHLSASTVKFHVRQILDKTGAANRVDLTHMATREGWV